MSPNSPAEYAALIREAFAEAMVAGFKAHEIGMTESQMLSMALPTMEPLVQTIVRKTARR
jgi:hypothetical protein